MHRDNFPYPQNEFRRGSKFRPGSFEPLSLTLVQGVPRHGPAVRRAPYPLPQEQVHSPATLPARRAFSQCNHFTRRTGVWGAPWEGGRCAAAHARGGGGGGGLGGGEGGGGGLGGGGTADFSCQPEAAGAAPYTHAAPLPR